MNRGLIKDLVLAGSILLVAFATMIGILDNRKQAAETQKRIDEIASQSDAENQLINQRLDEINEQILVIEDTQNKTKTEIEDFQDEVKSKFNNIFDRIHNTNEHITEVEESKELQKQQTYVATSYYTPSVNYESGYDHDFKSQGTVNDGTYNYTWYSQRVLPGGGLEIPGRHVDDDGFVRDEDGNLCIAARDIEKGTEVDTPYGKAIVYDYCPNGNLDIYTDW
jgi:hypothetical protein